MQNSSQKTTLKLPRVNTALILNICSFFICYFIGFGVVTSIVSLLLLNKDRKILINNPNVINKKSYKIAVITAWMVLLINALYLIFWIWLIQKIGWENIIDSELMKDSNFLKKAVK